MFINILYVAIGGALGASLRFIISNFLKNYFSYFPVGTLFVNVLGSLCIGILASYLFNKEISLEIIKYFLIIGFLGSFTTFSAFSIETIDMFKNGKIFMSFTYIFLSIFLSILAAYIGISYNKF